MPQRKKRLSEQEIKNIINEDVEFEKLDESGQVFYHAVKYRLYGDEKSYKYLQDIVKTDIDNIISGNHYYIKGFDDDDIRQECWIMLMEAAEKFDPRRGGDFRSFCRLLFNGSLITLVIRNRRKKNVLTNFACSFNQPIVSDNDGNVITYEDIIASDDLNYLDQMCVKEYHDLLKSQLYKELSPLERDSFECHLDGLTYKEAADELGISKKCYGNALQRSKSKTNQVFEKEIQEEKIKAKNKKKSKSK